MERLEKFTPIHPKKAAFYKSLLKFYKTVVNTVPIEGFTDKQMFFFFFFYNFNENGFYLPISNIDHVTILNKDVVVSMRATLTKYQFLIGIW